MEHAAQRPNPHPTFIFIDSQRTLRNYTNDTLNPVTASLVPRANVRYHDEKFRRTPGHQGVQGNETAHCFSCETSPVPATSWSTVYSAGTARNTDRALRKSRLKEPRQERVMYTHPPKEHVEKASLPRQKSPAQHHIQYSHQIFHHIYKRPDSLTYPKCVNTPPSLTPTDSVTHQPFPPLFLGGKIGSTSRHRRTHRTSGTRGPHRSWTGKAVRTGT